MVQVKKIALRDLNGDSEEKKYWSSKTIEEKIAVVEVLRNHLRKMSRTNKVDGNFKRLRRVLRVAKLK
jgi:hypothetical protein